MHNIELSNLQKLISNRDEIINENNGISSINDSKYKNSISELNLKINNMKISNKRYISELVIINIKYIYICITNMF